MSLDLPSRSRPSRHLAGAYVLFAVVGYWMQYHGSWRWSSVRTDSAIFRLAGQAVLEGSPVYEFRYLGYGWTYPPFGALVMAPLGLLSLPVVRFGGVLVALAVLALIVCMCFHDAIGRGSTRGMQALIGVAFLLAVIPLAPVFETLSIGQIGLFLMLAVLLDFQWLSLGNHKYVGVLTGIAAAIKLLPGIFMLYWLYRRQWRPFLTSCASFVACWTLAAIALPDDTWTYLTRGYLFRTSDRMAGAAESTVNQSLHGTFSRLLPGRVAEVVWLLVAVVLLVAGLRLARRMEQAHSAIGAVAALGLTSVLISPVSWVNHGVWVVPALAVLVGKVDDARAALLGLLCAVPMLIATALVWVSPLSEYFVVCYAVLLGCLAWFAGRQNPTTVDAER